MTASRVAAEVAEVGIAGADSSTRVVAEVAEVGVAGATAASRIAAEAIEVLTQGAASARLASVALEVLVPSHGANSLHATLHVGLVAREAPAGTVHASVHVVAARIPPRAGTLRARLTVGSVARGHNAASLHATAIVAPVTIGNYGQAVLTGTGTMVAVGAIRVAGRVLLTGRGQLSAVVRPRGLARRIVVVDQTGGLIAELENAVCGDVSFPLNLWEDFSFTLPVDDGKAVAVLAEKMREVQVWRGDQLLAWGPVTRPQVTDDGWMACRGKGVPWYLTRRYVGKANRINRLTNGDFESGLAGWSFLKTAYDRTYTNLGPTDATVASSPVRLGSRSLRLVSSLRPANFAQPDFDDSGWGTAQVVVRQDGVSNYWTGLPSTPAWPDPTAYWIGTTTSSEWAPTTDYYLRSPHFATVASKRVRCSFSPDNNGDVYVDGNKVLSANALAADPIYTYDVDITLPAGDHVVAAFMQNDPDIFGGVHNPTGLLFTMQEINGDGSLGTILVHSDGTWNLLDNPATVPGDDVAQWGGVFGYQNIVVNGGVRGVVATLAAWVYVGTGEFVGYNLGNRLLSLGRLPSDWATNNYWTQNALPNTFGGARAFYTNFLEFRQVQFDANFARDKWVRVEVSVTVPPGLTEVLHARLDGVQGVTHWDTATLTYDDALEFHDVDQELIVGGIVAHAQDPTYDKSSINLTVDGPLTGVHRDLVALHSEHPNIWRLVEDYTKPSDGVDVSCVYTPTERRLTVHYPARGFYRPNLGLALGRNIESFTWTFDGEAAATSEIALGDGGGSDREEGGAIDVSDYADGLILEEVFYTPPETRIEALPALAEERLNVARDPEIIEVVTYPHDPSMPERNLIGRLFTGDVVPVAIVEGALNVAADYRVVNLVIRADDRLALTLNKRSLP